ncbi:MAG: hypothetical protein KDD41_08500 [Flavobacteriales bacterium]|nr:hypothetical protein [Flavobacteriales bacterium]
MARVRILHLLLILIFTVSLQAQKITPFSSWTSNELKDANTGKYIKELSFQEKKIIFYVNLARMDGKRFAETYLKDYVEDERIPKNKYYRSLVKTLNEQPPLPILHFEEDLYKEAEKHAKEMGKTGKKGHRSAGHKSFEERMEKHRERYSKLKEVNQYGYPDALSIVVDLLIDDDKESLIQRKTLLNEDFRYIGVAIRAHKEYTVNTSFLLGGALLSD